MTAPVPVACRHCYTPLVLRGLRWVAEEGGSETCPHQDDAYGSPPQRHQPMPAGLAGAPDPADVIRYLTLYQPWAWLIAWGYKNVENRGRLYAAPGPVGIHAGSRIDRPALELPLVRAAIGHWLGNGYMPGVPPWKQGGAVVAVVDVFTGHLRRTAPAAGCDPNRLCSAWAFDDPGTWHHTLTGVTRIDPVPVRGFQQLWRPRDPGITREVLRRRDDVAA
jgi:hypothetical protein